jgi:ParB/RepB/Spo0J family partition protein
VTESTAGSEPGKAVRVGDRADVEVLSYYFRCSFCGSVIPWTVNLSDIGLDEADEPGPGRLYGYAKCYCGFGKFIRCESPAEASQASASPAGSPTAEKVRGAAYRCLPVDQVHPNPKQPRKFFEGEALRGLADSIRTVGLLEDILVRPVADGYEIVLGERRWRATQLAGLAEISAKIVDLDDDEVRSIAITENIHREDLTDVEEAFSFKSYIDEGREITEVGREFGGMEKRIADRLSVLSSHHYVEFQQQRIQELTETVSRLRGERQRPEPVHFEAKAVGGPELVAAIQDGFELVTQAGDDQYVLRRPLAR